MDNFCYLLKFTIRIFKIKTIKHYMINYTIYFNKIGGWVKYNRPYSAYKFFRMSQNILKTD